MKAKNAIRGMLYFLAGVAVTLALTFGFFHSQDARAASDCIRQSLIAYDSNGDIPKAQFTVYYKVPSCFTENGYNVVKVGMRSGRLAVTYKKN